jgi:hypothetical protein
LASHEWGDYQFLAGSRGFKDLSPAKLASSFLRGRLRSYLEQRRQYFRIAVRKDLADELRMAEPAGADARLR